MASLTKEQRRKNIERALSKVRKTSPAGTTRGATGRAGTKGSQQATGGGTTTIVVEAETGKSAVVPTSSVKKVETETKTPTTKGEFIQSLMQKQEDLKRTGQKVTVSPTGDVIIKAPASAKVDVARARQLAQERAKRQEREGREVTVFKGSATTRTPFGTQVVAVPSKEASERGEAKKVKFKDLSKEEKAEFLKLPVETYEQAFFYAARKSAKKRSESRLGPRYQQYKAIGEANLKNPFISKSISAGILVAKKTKKAGKFIDEKLIQIAGKIPEKWEPKLYKSAEEYRKERSLKEAGLSFLETVRTGEKQEVKLKKEKGIPSVLKETAPASAEFLGGYIGGLKRKPTQTVVSTVLFFAAPPIFKLAGKALAPATSFFVATFPRTASVLTKSVSIGLPTFYAGTVGYRAVKSERPFATVGGIASTEVTPMAVGGFLGTKFWPRVEGYFRTLGLKDVEKVSGYDIITPRARQGKLDKFSQEEQLNLFRTAKDPFQPSRISSIKQTDLLKGSFLYEGRKIPYPSGTDLTEWVSRYGKGALQKMYSTPKFNRYITAKNIETFKKPLTVLHAYSGVKRTAISEVIRKGGGRIDIETPYDYLRGAFVAPSDKGAAAFLGIGKKKTLELYRGSILNPYPSPTFAAIYAKGIRVRPSVPTGKVSFSGQEIRRFLGKDKPGVVDLPLRKTEPEGVITGDLKLIQERFFVKVRGVRVPIKEFKALGDTSKIKPRKPFKNLAIESELAIEEIFAQPIITPSSLIVSSSISSYKLPDYKLQISYKESSLPSYRQIRTTEVSTSSQPPSSKIIYSSGLPKSSSIVSKSSSISSLPSSVKSSTSEISSSSAMSGLSSAVSKASSQVSRPSSKVSSRVSEGISRTSSLSSGSSFSRSYYSSPYSDTPPPPTPIPGFNPRDFSNIAQAFDVQIKRFGEFKTISRSLPFGRATKIGTREAKRTLGATFRLLPAGTTQLKDIGFTPDPREFRQFTIKKGKKIPTPFQFIQRVGFRLAARSERTEIQKFKKLSTARRF